MVGDKEIMGERRCLGGPERRKVGVQRKGKDAGLEAQGGEGSTGKL